MNRLEQIYYDLTGTPYFKVQLMAHNHIMDVLSFKPDERIITSYGEFLKPKDEHKIYYKNNYYISYDVQDFKPLKLVKKSLIKKAKEIIKFHNIIIEFEDSEDKTIQEKNEPLIYIEDKISPKEFMAMLESESIIAVSKPKKEKNDLLTTNNIIIGIVIIVVGFVAYNFVTKGRLF